MFLSKSRGLWYVFFEDELGKRRGISTRCRLKTEALRSLQSFREADRARKAKLQRVFLPELTATFPGHSRGVRTPNTVRHHLTALAESERILGDVPLHRIGVREIDLFLAKKREEASEWAARWESRMSRSIDGGKNTGDSG
jgi:hypothetical protein